MQVAIARTISGSIYMFLVLADNGLVPVKRSGVTALAVMQVSGTDTGMPQGCWLKLERFYGPMLPGYAVGFTAYDKVTDEQHSVTTSWVEHLDYHSVSASVPLKELAGIIPVPATL